MATDPTGEQEGPVWLLLDGGTEVARLVVTESDWPWKEARLEPGPGFAEVRPLFDEEWRLCQLIGDSETPEWTAAYQAIRKRLHLIDPGGWAVPEFMLHIEGGVAWWRMRTSHSRSHEPRSRATR